jgi:hypothetical protein
MVCRRCNYEFCWQCQMAYSGYRHQPPQYEYYCPMRQVLYFFAIVFCIQMFWVKCSLPYDAYMAE